MFGVLVGEGAICALYIFAGRGLWSDGRELIGLRASGRRASGWTAVWYRRDEVIDTS